MVGRENWVMMSLIVWIGVNRGKALLLVNGSCMREETGSGRLA